ncbi:diguanylate cyclase domain-containing protein [Buttiauxella massiliensis]|uniref:diguanylate cyclase domain-containing protein n=1 Tax=Buttiauxella massiliensis TaxID=2831590 RepID=UPI0038992565
MNSSSSFAKKQRMRRSNLPKNCFQESQIAMNSQQQQLISCLPDIGISIYPEHGQDVATLLKKADVAMYYIKDKGKNNVIFYDEIAMTLPT